MLCYYFLTNSSHDNKPLVHDERVYKENRTHLYGFVVEEISECYYEEIHQTLLEHYKKSSCLSPILSL